MQNFAAPGFIEMIEAGRFLQQRYRIDRQIGQGGMGAVYVATDERFGSTVAIKETLCMDENFRKAIEREARLLNSLKHSALPRVSDHFEESDGQFLVMEYIPGEDVAEMLEARKAPFPVDQVLKWADQLLDALDYLHTQELPVIHRDIKPQNLKINARGEMILLDFGLAKGNPTDTGHQTAAKSIFGYSRSYASLEQIQGTGTDPRSDLYSLAATLYHLLTGNPPEDALTRAMSVLNQKPDPLVPANILNPAVPAGVAGVLQHALDLNASERPQSASEMREMLRSYDQYAGLAAPRPFLSDTTDPRVFAQRTQIMPVGTLAGNGITAGAAPDPVPGDISQVTSVRTAGGDTVPVAVTEPVIQVSARRKRFGVRAMALAVVLAVFVLGAGFYAVGPALFGGSKAVETPQTPEAQAPVAAAANSEPARSEPSDLPVAAEPDKPAAVPEKPSETAKAKSPNAPSSKAKRDDQGDSLDVTDDDPDLPPGGLVLTQRDADGKLKTIRVKPGKAPKVSIPSNGNIPFFPGLDTKVLNEEQIRRLQQMEKMRVQRQIREQQQRKTATPHPTEQPEGQGQTIPSRGNSRSINSM